MGLLLNKLGMIPFKPLLSMLSPGAAAARLSVLIFHRVLPAPDPMFPGEVDARQFDQIIGWIRTWCNVLPLDEAVSRLAAHRLPARAAAITFDDGYADNHVQALPILQRHKLTATFFIATGFLDGGRMWNDTIIEAVRGFSGNRIDLQGMPGLSPEFATVWPASSIEQKRDAIQSIIGQIKYALPDARLALANEVSERLRVKLPSDLMMTSTQVRALRREGMQIGAHTHSHPILARLAPEVVRSEIARSKHALEDLLGESVDLFAYPNGRPGIDYSAQNVSIVRDLGFSAAVSTAPGAANSRSDRFQLPRFTPWDRTRMRFGLRLAANLVAAAPALA